MGLIVGVAAPAPKFALIGPALIKSPNGEPGSIYDAVLADRRAVAAVFLTPDELCENMPELAKITDFRFPNCRKSAEEIIDAIVLMLTGTLANIHASSL